MSKNRFVNKCFIALLLAVGAVIITVAYVVGATISHSNAKKSYARTLDYMKKQCISYIEVTSSDEVKSLVRITEQADVIRTDIDRYTGAEGAALLQEYIDSQRLAGAVITDGSLDPVVERHSLGSGYDEWENIIRSTYVSGVMGYPQKIYSERINKSDGCYDIAAVSRTDGDGVVFCYKYQNSAILELTQDPLKNMLAGYETILDGSLFITDGDTILGSNIEEYRGKDVSEFELIEKLDQSSAANRLLRIKSAGRQTYFGGKSSCLGYNIYVFYPHTTVYSTCRSVVIFALGTYMALVLFILILYARTNQAYFREMSSQYETTRTISRIYISSFLIDLKNNRYEYLNLPYLKNRVSREAALSRNLSEMTSLSAVGEN